MKPILISLLCSLAIVSGAIFARYINHQIDYKRLEAYANGYVQGLVDGHRKIPITVESIKGRLDNYAKYIESGNTKYFIAD